jgi:hypothetical protein
VPLLLAEPSSPSPAAIGKTCTLNSDCQSGACEDGRCAEAKYCASRFLYDTLGVNIQLKTFEGKVADLHEHQQPIKCGQCVCKDCPVSARPRRLQKGAPLARPRRSTGPAWARRPWPCPMLSTTQRGDLAHHAPLPTSCHSDQHHLLVAPRL